MKKKILLVIGIFGVLSIFILLYNKNDDRNNKICETVKIPIKGIIVGQGGSGSYQWIQVNNLKVSISVGFSDIKYVHGLTDSYIDTRIGDSIIKKAGSREMMIKRKDEYGVFELSCN